MHYLSIYILCSIFQSVSCELSICIMWTIYLCHVHNLSTCILCFICEILFTHRLYYLHYLYLSVFCVLSIFGYYVHYLSISILPTIYLSVFCALDEFMKVLTIKCGISVLSHCTVHTASCLRLKFIIKVAKKMDFVTSRYATICTVKI